MLPATFSCPRCKCGACHRLHRKGFDWVMSFLGFRPMGCLTCGKRFYARYSVVKAHLQNEPNSVYNKSDAGKTDLFPGKGSSKAA